MYLHRFDLLQCNVKKSFSSAFKCKLNQKNWSNAICFGNAVARQPKASKQNMWKLDSLTDEFGIGI